ncbi:MAG: c-type cytochrome, partial [Candidatus Solibacter usitatus]|nr:c-type cytochrome [Candidatus Solibacter usitatus]
NNSNHLRHEVIAARYLRRNPDLPVMNAMQDLSDHGNGAEVYPITRNPRYEMLTEVGTMTSACGLTLFQGASFVAEPVHGLVHRDLWKPAGASFSASRAYQREEFLASTDAWFRPVNFYVGPDGALYLMDYYRLSIEHPEWMSTHTHNSPDLYEGNDRGRIYRIVPEGGSPADRNLRLGEAPDEELVKQLGNANPWWRRNAQRLLMDRKSVAAAPLLERMAREDASAVARLHALWTLDGLGKLDRGLIERALSDPNPGVRENAIILGEAHLPALGAKLIAMASDADPRVEFQLLCTLGFIDSAASRAARDGLLSRRLEDRWMQIAALSASSGDAPRLYEWAQAGAPSEGRTNLIRLAASVIGERQRPAELRKVLASPTAAGLEGLAMGLRAKRGPGAQTMALGQEALLKVFDGDDAPLRKAVLRLLEVTGLPSRAAAGAAARAFDAQAKPDQRADALGLLALADPKPHEAMLRRLVDPGQPEAVQAAAIHALGVIPGEEIGKFLLSKWKTLTAPARSEAADALLNENGRARLLVAAIKDGQVQPWNLVFRHKRRLQMHRDPEIRETARPLLEPKAGEREKVVAQYQPAAERKGDTARGQAVFKEVCAKCHKHNGVGADVGPDLGSVRNRSKQSLLEEILMPNKSISQNYEAYVIETTSGATREGVMGPQTSTTITLRHEDGKEDVIQRSNIKSMYVTNLSAMPADLEHQVSVQQMGDLLEYLTR